MSTAVNVNVRVAAHHGTAEQYSSLQHRAIASLQHSSRIRQQQKELEHVHYVSYGTAYASMRS